MVKVSAASLDDVPAQVAKTTGKVSGIVIDDTAVTPKYVVGLDPSRELSIIYQIAKKSLINKILILSPAALVLGYFAPWAITPILMLGGAYLCFEGYEKVHSMLSKHDEVHAESEQVKAITPEELEKERVTGAVRTDIILSAEIMAIAYSQVTGQPIANQILVMLAVAVFITVAVYGFVGLIVKADDIGLHLAGEKFGPATQKIGRGIVKFMPSFLRVLSYVGTAAMLWVGAEIIAHGIPFTAHLLHDLEQALANVPALAWLAKVLACGIGGLILGFFIDQVVRLVKKVWPTKKEAPTA
ncbi:ABC transporter [Hymenobacter glacieicola]|uniref:ABC transporter n=1 Tax=Hymenobacter glacieicola TaxID=1562124 RepID=A0ABQ1WRK6_9BACT|nr:ABC transporter [Hymenobacter glacieicola]